MSHACRAIQDRRGHGGESSDKMWSIGEENGKPLQHSCGEPHEQYQEAKIHDTEK